MTSTHAAAHRVLLSASQQRFYYSYLGGQVLGAR